MEAAANFILHLLDHLQPWQAAILVGWGISAGITQSVKFLVPMSVYHGYREQITRLLAIVTAAIPAGIVFEVIGGKPPSATMWVALGAGLWSPLAFAILQAILKRYAPWLADVLSQDVRGQTDTRP